MARSAPKTGYDFGNKRQYRRAIWAKASKFLAGRRKIAQVLLMPSTEGGEIQVALSKGFLQQNMHVVDKNPAIVAHLKSRFPLINTYGVDLLRALDRMAQRGIEINFANLDFCSNIDGLTPYLTILGSMRKPFSNPNMVFVTSLRGREMLIGILASMQKAMEAETGVIMRPDLPVNTDRTRVVAMQNSLAGFNASSVKKILQISYDLYKDQPPPKSGREALMDENLRENCLAKFSATRMEPQWNCFPIDSHQIYRSGTQTMMYQCFIRHAHGECSCALCE